MAISALPPSSSCSDAATASYRAGLQAVRESSYEAAHGAFSRAVELDDGCASAHLRLVLAADSDPRTMQREHLRKATLGRATLSERDRSVLPALEALVARDTPNWEAFRSAAERARDASPLDAELHFLAALANRSLDVRWADVREEAQRAVQLDPDYGDAWQVLADAEQELGHEADALRALDSCLRVAPGSLDCLAYRVEADRAQGRCAEIATAARRKVSLNPTGPSGHALLSAALFDTGADAPVVLEVLQQRWAVVPAAARRSTELSDRSALAVLSGDFGAARDVARAMERLAEGDPNLAAHVDGAHLDLELAVESGQAKVAASVAEAFLRRRAAWIPGDNASNQTAAYMPIFIDALLRGGLVDEATARQRVDAWFAIRGPVTVVDDWAFREALFVTDESQARRAVERYDPGWLSRMHNQWRKVWARSNRRARIVGSVLVRAGRASEAIPWLRGVTQSCTSLETPFEAVRARRWLGEALERTGDKAGACGAYAAVVARWGKAKPRSVTAEEAAGRAKALGCEMAGR
jgi:serine/threonine-protein kinase